MDPALLESGYSSESSVTGKPAEANMDIDNGTEELSAPLYGDYGGGHHDHSASACLSNTTLSSSSATGPNSAMLRAVICELALMGPVSTLEEASSVLSWASKAAGGHMQGHCLESLVSAASEWLSRSFDVGSKEFDNALDSVDFAQDLSVAGCTASLVQLKKARLSRPDWIAFRKDTVPLSNGYVKEMTIDTFVQNIDPHATVHVRSLVLAARLLWPDEQEKVYELIRCSFDESKTCGLECEKDFEAMWSLDSNPEVNKEFAECILHKLLIMEQLLLWNIHDA